MKKLLYISLVLFVVLGCKKSEDVNPQDLAGKVAGTYNVTTVINGSTTYNFPVSAGGVTLSAVLVVTKVTDTSVNAVITQKTTGQPDDSDNFGTFDLKGADLYQGSTKYGTADGTNFNIDFTQAGVRNAILSKR